MGTVLTDIGRRAGGLPAADLVERDDHLRTLDHLAEGLPNGGAVVLVSGEAGVGKTALVRRFCAGRRERVLWGGCDALFTPRPLGPLLEIAEAAGGELGRLLETAARPHEVVGALVRAVAAGGPTVLVVEDVHWADEATLDVLRLLARAVGEIPALVVVTYRDDELDPQHPLRTVLGELRPRSTTHRLEVEPLSPAGVGALAGASGRDAAAVHRATAGNPFFVVEVLAAEAEIIPPTVRDAVLGRAARLSREARRVLDAVAVTPPHAGVWLLEAIAGDATDHLDECVSAGMLTEVSGGLAFRHELARRAIDEALPPRRRVLLHRAALAALAARTTGVRDLARLAHHAEAAGDAEAVLRYAPAAALHAGSVGAQREAVAQYARALRWADGQPAEQRADLWESLAQAQYVTDEMHDATDALDNALTLRRELGDASGEGAVLCALSRTLWCAGRRAEAIATSDAALHVLESVPPGPHLAMAYSSAGHVALNEEDMTGAVSWAQRALDVAESIGHTPVVVHALNTLGTVDLLHGGGTERLDRSLALAEQAGLDEQVGRAYIHLSWGITRTRSYDLASRLDEGVEACGHRGLEVWRLYLLVARARADLDRGRWAEAADTAAEVLRYARSVPLLRILALCIIGVVRARRGDPERWAPLDEAESLLQPDDGLQALTPVARARAEAAWLEGHGPDAVVAATERALDLAVQRRSGWTSGELLLWRRLAGADDAVPAHLAGPYPLALHGDWAAAATAWTALGCPYDAALATSQVDDAEVARSALEELQRIGARPAGAIVSRALRQRGVREIPRGPRPTTRANPAQLTARELGVLELVVQGLPNSEIAARLFLSTKTVDKHVSATLRKLGARSRSEASAAAVRRGIVQLDQLS
ncbi:MAG TPA: AAA family ATPase [Mycobacteriales bacterium]|nr:AAA family ATPase [Mycobacteriales bacterium]